MLHLKTVYSLEFFNEDTRTFELIEEFNTYEEVIVAIENEYEQSWYDDELRIVKSIIRDASWQHN